jgi:undecaprenyl-diphosphatase
MKRKILVGCVLLGLFLLWTMAVCLVDVQIIGPNESCVGFASINGYVHDLTGVNFSLYILTDWLSLIPMGAVAGFWILGLKQWIQRRSLWKVDRDILALGVFYLAVGAVFAFFEIAVINYRPVLIEGVLEASYPSSTTMLVLCVMGTAALQFHQRIRNRVLQRWVILAVYVFTAFMVAGRLLSGVHWVTDIIGGGLLSGGLVAMYDGISEKISICNT